MKYFFIAYVRNSVKILKFDTYDIIFEFDTCEKNEIWYLWAGDVYGIEEDGPISDRFGCPDNEIGPFG